MTLTPTSGAGVSGDLHRFTAECPHERQSILDFALRVAAELEPGSRLIDVGAGNSPYRELFAHLRYESTDWQHSPHPGARAVDHIGPAHDLPVPDGEYDAVLCTQVLEHTPNPGEVIRELHRVLRPGGRLYMTVPLAWELHELPFDFYRYTPHGLASLLAAAGFERLDIRPRNDCFETLAQLLQNAPTMVGSYPDGRDREREEAKAVLRAMAAKVESYVGLDSRWIFPLGYSAVATRPAGDDTATAAAFDDEAPVDRHTARAAVGLGAARRFMTLCFASDLLADPRLLSSYAARFTATDDATLVIYAPHTDQTAAGALLMALVETLGLDSPQSPDMIGLPFSGRGDERLLASGADAVLAVRPPWGVFAGLPWAHGGTLDAIHRLSQGELG
jgi:SAM-dependent methyltransferase